MQSEEWGRKHIYIYRNKASVRLHLSHRKVNIQNHLTMTAYNARYQCQSVVLYLQPLVGTSVQKVHTVVGRRNWRHTAVELSPQCIYHTLIPIL